ncbi:hypothetical protein HMI54_007335, partial [Coelomomyces lativittatus]
AGIIIIVIIANTAFGFFTEIKSAKTIDALKKLSTPTAKVIRDHGEVMLVSSTQLVPGDIVCLDEGDQVSADIRLFETMNLKLNEALLTGESEPVKKKVEPVDSLAPLGDQTNMVFQSTLVSLGRGKGLVVATGADTEIGKIAQSVAEASFSFKRTPLENSMARMMHVLIVVAFILIWVVLASSYFDWSNERVWLYAVSLAVAILPECLPIVTMVTMSIGVSKMAKEKAIVRKQVSLELLGRVTHICSDKTGTLTEGKMTMTTGWLYTLPVSVEGAFAKSGNFHFTPPLDNTTSTATVTPWVTSEKEIEVVEGKAMESTTFQWNHPLLDFFLIAGLCNTCEIQLDLDTQQYVGLGDTTEVALGVVAAREGFSKCNLVNAHYTLLAEFPFDSSLKRMTVVYKENKSQDLLVLSKGALESIWPFCVNYGVLSASSSSASASSSSLKVHPTSETYYEKTVLPKMLEMSMKGQRVLALALRRIPVLEVTSETLSWISDLSHRGQVESGFSFLGLVGIVDPPRPETSQSIRDCHRAGISVHMITGDHPITAAAIAREIGILPPLSSSTSMDPIHDPTTLTTQDGSRMALSPTLTRELVMTSVQFDALTEEEVDQLIELPLVVARCSPDTKVNMIRALHRRGKCVAMTGDGVNDAPAVSHADIGIAMGLGGSDVTKQASDITLTDDKFSSIVKAIAQGRRIFANIQKFSLHLLSGNVSEMVVLVCGLAIRNSLNTVIYPMSPSQILYVNLVTSSPVALALGIELASKKIMQDPPRTQSLFTKDLMLDTVVYGSVLGLLSLLCFLAVLVFPGYHLTLEASCDKEMDPNQTCEPVFRARAVGFVTLCLLLLLHGFVCRHPRRSSFYFQFKDSKWLVYFALFFGVLSAILPYIPIVNTEFFHHSAFSWEWVYVFASILLFIGFTEMYKGFKRRNHRLHKFKKNHTPRLASTSPSKNTLFHQLWKKKKKQGTSDVV